MEVLGIWLRTARTGLILSLIPALLGFWVAGRIGAVIGLGLSIAGILSAAIVSERWILRKVFEAKRGSPQIEETLQTYSVHSTRIFLIQDPIPLLQPLKSMGSAGTLIISTGLIKILNDDEIQSLIGNETKRMNSALFVNATVCLAMSRAFYSLMPSGWKNLAQTQIRPPHSAWSALIVSSFAHFFSKQAREISLLRPSDFERLLAVKGFNPVFVQSDTTSRLDPHTFLFI